MYTDETIEGEYGNPTLLEEVSAGILLTPAFLFGLLIWPIAKIVEALGPRID